jgi:signal transduction histidine kinase
VSSVPAGSSQSLPALLVQWRRWVVLATLLSLHAGLVSEDGSGFQRVWMMVHFGLFLLWQPVFSTEREVNIVTALLLLAITGAVIYRLDGWMLVVWVAILIGIMGGKVFTLQAARRSRFYLVGVFYLFTVLLIWTVPVSLLQLPAIPAALRGLVTIFLPMTLASLAVLPFRAEDESTTQVFDFFYSLIVFQLVVVLILGSIAAMRVTDNQYFQSVVLTVFAFSAALFVLAVLWGPRTGFGGLRTYFSRYLMSVGMPFELWMRRIAELSEAETSSARFLENAMGEVEQFPWIVGGIWLTPEGPGRFGKDGGYDAHFKYHELEITFFTEIRLSPAMFLHLRLLAQVISEFYEGKRREQAMKQNAYMQAVYETGARLTHDMKNLLQSLYALTSAGVVARENDRRSKSEYQTLLERQLPVLAKRLQATLDKLQNPALGSTSAMLPARDWWNEVLLRQSGSGIVLDASGSLTTTIPSNLFDTILENCLENARKKREREPRVEISVSLSGEPSPSLAIRDTGSAIPVGAVDGLFRQPVTNSRRGGFGIGLYQAARQAEQQGYDLVLSANEPGNVCFELRPRLATEHKAG